MVALIDERMEPFMAAEVDMETCSWCLDEVPDSTLRERPDGARICRRCRDDLKHGRVVGQE
jgi:hypothetical protein